MNISRLNNNWIIQTIVKNCLYDNIAEIIAKIIILRVYPDILKE